MKICHSLVNMLGGGAGWSGDIVRRDSFEDEPLLLEGRRVLEVVVFVLSKRGLTSSLLGDRCSIDRLAPVANDFSAIWSELASTVVPP